MLRLMETDPTALAKGRGGDGIECPECGRAENEVKDSRKGPGYVRRRRVCAGGHRFSTYELSARDWRRATAEMRDLLRAISAQVSSAAERVASISNRIEPADIEDSARRASQDRRAA